PGRDTRHLRDDAGRRGGTAAAGAGPARTDRDVRGADAAPAAVHDRPRGPPRERGDRRLRPADLRLHGPARRGGGGRPLPVAADPRPGPRPGPVGRGRRVAPSPASSDRPETLMARVDVVVPCYNYAHFLEGCVESALR